MVYGQGVVGLSWRLELFLCLQRGWKNSSWHCTLIDLDVVVALWNKKVCGIARSLIWMFLWLYDTARSLIQVLAQQHYSLIDFDIVMALWYCSLVNLDVVSLRHFSLVDLEQFMALLYLFVEVGIIHGSTDVDNQVLTVTSQVGDISTMCLKFSSIKQNGYFGQNSYKV